MILSGSDEIVFIILLFRSAAVRKNDIFSFVADGRFFNGRLAKLMVLMSGTLTLRATMDLGFLKPIMQVVYLTNLIAIARFQQFGVFFKVSQC